MDYNSLSLKMHEEHKGKVEVQSHAVRFMRIRLTYTNIHARATWLLWYQMEQRFSALEI